jgi:hypothetical protein
MRRAYSLDNLPFHPKETNHVSSTANESTEPLDLTSFLDVSKALLTELKQAKSDANAKIKSLLEYFEQTRMLKIGHSRRKSWPEFIHANVYFHLLYMINHASNMIIMASVIDLTSSSISKRIIYCIQDILSKLRQLTFAPPHLQDWASKLMLIFAPISRIVESIVCASLL